MPSKVRAPAALAALALAAVLLHAAPARAAIYIVVAARFRESGPK